MGFFRSLICFHSFLIYCFSKLDRFVKCSQHISYKQWIIMMARNNPVLRRVILTYNYLYKQKLTIDVTHVPIVLVKKIRIAELPLYLATKCIDLSECTCDSLWTYFPSLLYPDHPIVKIMTITKVLSNSYVEITSSKHVKNASDRELNSSVGLSNSS